ncbi:MAG: hypothetical protein WKG01_25965 [Kofleriaceae bacterium]
MPRDELLANLADRDAVGVYADRLLEQGGSSALRGELIQLGLVATPTDAHRAREAELVALLDRAWKARGAIVERRGGFAVRWRCTPAQFADHAAVAFAEEPLLCAVVVKYASSGALAQSKLVARTPELARIIELDLVGHNVRAGRPGAKGLAAILGSPHWPAALEALRLPTCALGDAGGKLIASSASLASLRELELFSNELKARTVVAIAASPHLRELRVLDLEQNKIGDAGVMAIANTTQLTKLERIVTVNTWMPRVGVEPIAARFGAALVHTGQQEPKRKSR